MNIKLKMLLVYVASLTFDSANVCAQLSRSGITAKQIVQQAIDSSGGDLELSAINSVEYITQVITADKDTLSFAIKKRGFNKNYISILSLRHVNSTRIYNNGKAVEIINDTVREITDPNLLENLSLQCYISIPYSYKKLGYKLSRLDDQKFENFDCYVVKAESPMGNQTMNYFDKNTGDLLMIIYPNEGKTIFMYYNRLNGVKIPSSLLLADSKNNVSTSVLKKLNYDINLDIQWFEIPPAGYCQAPAKFRKGSFVYVNSNVGSKMVRTEKEQIEINGQNKTSFRIDWQDNSNYLLYRLKKPAEVPKNENIEYFKVRIIAWKGNIYYCHYISSDGLGGTCA